MTKILLCVAIVNALVLYSCCVVSGRISRQEEEDEIFQLKYLDIN